MRCLEVPEGELCGLPETGSHALIFKLVRLYLVLKREPTLLFYYRG